MSTTSDNESKIEDLIHQIQNIQNQMTEELDLSASGSEAAKIDSMINKEKLFSSSTEEPIKTPPTVPALGLDILRKEYQKKGEEILSSSRTGREDDDLLKNSARLSETVNSTINQSLHSLSKGSPRIHSWTPKEYNEQRDSLQTDLSGFGGLKKKTLNQSMDKRKRRSSSAVKLRPRFDTTPGPGRERKTPVKFNHRRSSTSIETGLNVARSQVRSMKTQLHSMKSKLAEEMNRNSELEEQLKNETKKFQQKYSECNKLKMQVEATVNSYEKQMGHLKKKVRELKKSEPKELPAYKRNLLDENDELRLKIKKLKGIINDLNQNTNATAQNEIDNATGNDSNSLEAQALKRKLRDVKKKYDRDMGTIKKYLEEMREKNTNDVRMIEKSKKEEVSRLNRILNQYKKQNEDSQQTNIINDRLKKVEKQKEILFEENEQLKTQIASLDRLVAEKTQTLKRVVTENLMIKTKVKDMENDHSVYQENITRAERMVEHLRKEFDEETVNLKKSFREDYEAKFEELKNQYHEKQESIRNSLEKKLDDLRTSSEDKLNNEREKYQAKISQLTEELNEKKEKFDKELRTSQDLSQKELSTLRQSIELQLEELQTENAELKSKLDGKKSFLNGEIEVLQETIDMERNLCQSLKEQLSQLQDQLNESKEANAKLKAQLSKYQMENDRLTDVNTSITSTYSDMEVEINDKDKEINKLKSKLSEKVQSPSPVQDENPSVEESKTSDFVEENGEDDGENENESERNEENEENNEIQSNEENNEIQSNEENNEIQSNEENNEIQSNEEIAPQDSPKKNPTIEISPKKKIPKNEPEVNPPSKSSEKQSDPEHSETNNQLSDEEKHSESKSNSRLPVPTPAPTKQNKTPDRKTSSKPPMSASPAQRTNRPPFSEKNDQDLDDILKSETIDSLTSIQENNDFLDGFDDFDEEDYDFTLEGVGDLDAHIHSILSDYNTTS